MRLYPELPARRTRSIAADAALLLSVLVFAWLGVKVHDGVDRLSGLGSGVASAGTSVQDGFRSAAGAVRGTPLVGGDVGDALESAGRATGGNAVAAGRRGEHDAHSLANLLGWLTFLIPTALVAQRVLPGRVREVRSLTAATRVLGGNATPERRELIARRAAFGLPYGRLVRYTPDPLGDLAAGRLDPLVRAACEDAGLRPPA